MYKLNARDHFNTALPSFSHDQHHETDAAKRKGGAISDISNKLTCDLLTLKVVSESRVTWATSVPILVFPALSVLELGLMYARDVRQKSDKSIT